MQHYGQALEVLFYEVLDMPLRDYEQLKHMKVLDFCPSHPGKNAWLFAFPITIAACLAGCAMLRAVA